MWRFLPARAARSAGSGGDCGLLGRRAGSRSTAARIPRALACFGVALLPLPGAARAETTLCTEIASVPVVITTQGAYCLRKHLSTGQGSGAAITVQTNNVTIDCNGYKLGGQAAGAGSTASGISALGRLNITVRNCSIRGFNRGISLRGVPGGGHQVIDNRLDFNLHYGIDVAGTGNLVQRNRVIGTGGKPDTQSGFGIFAEADVLDNTVEGVSPSAADAWPTGIVVSGAGSVARGNRVSGLVRKGTGLAMGIHVSGRSITVAENTVSAATTTGGYGIRGLSISGVQSTICQQNRIVRFSTAFGDCLDNYGNAEVP